ncbi:MAG: diadenylate cyclase [Candidatus Latescibacteria bacterium]|jgi:DNA integrity scanning protein DisA with diadenylate cyclase activity|nr:diadenylate cyclase [Candidatus Latescibacterota bacterium]
MAKSTPNKNHTQALLTMATNLAHDIRADMILLVADSGIGRAAVQTLNTVCQTLVVTRSKGFLAGIEETGVQRLSYDYGLDDASHFERVRQCIILGMEGGYIRRGNRLVCLARMIAPRGVDAMMVVNTNMGFEGYDPIKIAALAGDMPLEVVKTALDLAVDIGQEGREGEPVGTLFVVGDSERVLHHSRSMTFDPFRGYSEREKNISNPDIHEGVKEVALMDGAFIIQEDGVILSGGRYISADVQGLVLPKGLGARHVAAASITKTTRAIALAVSESTGTVRAFKRGEIVLQLNPHRRRIKHERRR